MTELDNVRPRVPFILHIIEVGSKGNKNTYFGSSSLNDNVIVELRDKWCKTMNDEIRLHTISKAFKIAKTNSPSVYQHFIQYKLLHRRVVNNKLLYKMGISETPNCLFCHNIETIEHIYIECENVTELWNNTEKWVRRLYSPHFKISDTEKVFGEKNKLLLSVLKM